MEGDGLRPQEMGIFFFALQGQKCVALSTTEAEYIAATEAGKDICWMMGVFTRIGFEARQACRLETA